LPDIDLRTNLHMPGLPGTPGASQATRDTPSATVLARLTPWTAPFVPQAHARWQHLDLAAL